MAGNDFGRSRSSDVGTKESNSRGVHFGGHGKLNLADIQRQEGQGAGDGVRLRGRSKALKGATPRADLAWNKASRHEADESVERSRKPEDASELGEVSQVHHAAAKCEETLKGSKPYGRSRGALVVSKGTVGKAVAMSS